MDAAIYEEDVWSRRLVYGPTPAPVFTDKMTNVAKKIALFCFREVYKILHATSFT